MKKPMFPLILALCACQPSTDTATNETNDMAAVDAGDEVTNQAA